VTVHQLPSAIGELRQRSRARIRQGPHLDPSAGPGARTIGHTVPRLWTPPLVELTPATSYGYDVVTFAADVLGQPLDPWEAWSVVHLGELLPDGRPRFRVVLILVARQNGKTTLAKVLTLYWLFVDLAPMILATSTDRNYAKRVWLELCDQALGNPLLAADLGPRAIRRAIGEESITTTAGACYRFAATNRRAGRSLTVCKAILDEVREHVDFSCYGAVKNAMNAVPDAQLVCISNQGDDGAVVLDALRTPALEYIETGQGDPRLGLQEWSAPDGADPTDLQALAAANPNLGRRIHPDDLLGEAQRAKAAGGDELGAFRTETLCQRIHRLDAAVDPGAWERCGAGEPVDLAQHRQRVALCIDVSLDMTHATATTAALLDGTVRVENAGAWSGPGCTTALRRELPALVAQIRPRVVGWFPGGPAASLAAAIDAPKGRRSWAPRGTTVTEITSDVAACCMGLAELVESAELRHPDDDLMTDQVGSAAKGWRGDRWVFVRRGAGPVDAAYSLAGAVHLARTMPPPLEPVQGW
jgi:hypothetical protein